MARVDTDVLDYCLLQIQTGESTLEQCLADNSAHSDLLEPLLRLAIVTQTQLAPTEPSQDFVAYSPTRVMNLIKSRTTVSAPSRKSFWTWQPAYRFAGVLIALTLVVGSFGAASASGNALPGDNLYSLKRGLERAALVVSLTAEGDAELWLEYANRRIVEVEELLLQGRSNDIGPALEGYELALAKGLELATDHQIALGNLAEALSSYEQALAGVIGDAPEQALPGLRRALANSRKGKDSVEEILTGRHPSEVAPGQLRKTEEASESEPMLPPGQLKKEEAQERDIPPGQLKKTETPGSDGSD